MSTDTRLLGIQLELDSKGVVVGADTADVALQKIRTSATKTQATVTEATARMAGGVGDVAAGAKTFGDPIAKAGDKVFKFFEGTVGVAGNAEESMDKVSFSMGLIGAKAKDPELQKAFKAIQSQLVATGEQIGISTSEAAEGFYKLKSAGLSAVDSAALVKYAQALVTSSQGQMSMAESAKVTSLIMNKFGKDVKGTGLAIDGLIHLSTQLNVPFTDMRQMLMSLGNVSTKFAATSFEEFMAMAGVMRTMGVQATQSTSLITTFGNSVEGVLKTMEGRGRAGRAQRKIFEQYGFTREMFVDGQGNFRAITAIIGNVEQQLSGLSKKQRSAALKAIFGNQQVGLMLDHIRAGTAKQGKTIGVLAAEMKSSGGTALSAQKDYMNSWKGIMKIWKGSTDELKVAIGKALLPVLKPIVKWLTGLVKAFSAWSKENPKLAKTIMVIVVAFAILAKLLGVTITLLGAMAAVVTITGPAMAAGSAGVFTLSGAFWTLAASVWAALWPVLLVIASIAISLLFLYAAYLVIKNFGTIWVWVKGVFWDAVTWIVAGAKYLWEKITWPFLNIRKTIAFLVASYVKGLRMFLSLIWYSLVTVPTKAAGWLIDNWRQIPKFLMWMVKATGKVILAWVGLWWKAMVWIWEAVKWGFTELPLLILKSMWLMFKIVMKILGQVLGGIKDGLGEGFKDIIDGITAWAIGIWDSAMDIGRKLIDGIKQGATDAWDGLKTWFLGKVKWIRDLWPFSPAKVGPLRTLNKGGEGIINEVSRGVRSNQGKLDTTLLDVTASAVKPTGLAPQQGTEEGLGFWGSLPSFALSDADTAGAASVSVAGSGGGGASGGGINITISKMEFHTGKLTPGEAEAFTNAMMKKIAQKLKQFKERQGGQVS